MKKIITALSLLLLVIPTTTLGQQKEDTGLILATMLTALPAHCAPTKEVEKVFTVDQLVFTGLIDKSNIFKIYINKEGAWSSMLQSVSGLSCVYFSGIPGVIKLPKPKVKEDGT
jgi:hypothetical protein